MSKANKKLGWVDAAWLRMEERTNPMTITGLLLFKSQLSPATMRKLIEERIMRMPRFARRLRERPVGPPVWERDPLFDLDAHLRHVALPGAGDAPALMQLISELASAPLQLDRPLWQLHLVDNVRTFQDGSVGSAIVCRVHHTVGDGVKLTKMLLSCMDDGNLAAAKKIDRPKQKPQRSGWRALALEAKNRVASLEHLTTLRREKIHPLHIPPGTQKRLDVSAPVSLAALRAAAELHNCKVNDLLLTAFSGAISKCFGSEPPELRAMMPVFFAHEDEAALGNQFGLAFVDLPTGALRRDERLATIRFRTTHVKSSEDATTAFTLLGVLGLVNRSIEKLGVRFFTGKATVLVSNVPGPSAPVSLYRHPVESINVWAPMAGELTMSACWFGYGDGLRLSLAYDAKLPPAAAQLTKAFVREVEALVDVREPDPVGARPAAMLN